VLYKTSDILWTTLYLIRNYLPIDYVRLGQYLIRNNSKADRETWTTLSEKNFVITTDICDMSNFVILYCNAIFLTLFLIHGLFRDLFPK